MINDCLKIIFTSRCLFACCMATAFLAGCVGTTQSSRTATANEAAEKDQAAPEIVTEPALLAPTSEDVMFNVFAAEHLGSEGDLKGAVGYYLEAAMESSDPEIAHRATRVAFAAQSWQQAAMAADRWALLDPDSVPAHENAAAAMLLTGDYASAELQIQQIMDLMGNSDEAWLKVSAILAQSANPERASSVLENVLARQGNVNNASAMYAQSQLAVRGRDLEKAYQLAVQAVDLEPDRTEFLTWAGGLALNLNKTGAGLKYIERAWQLNPEDHDLALAYADLLARTGQADAARKVMEEIPQIPDVVFSRILFEIADGKDQAAEALFEEMSGMKFDDPLEKAYYQAQAAEALGKIQQAIDLYGRVDVGDYALGSGLRRAELMAREGDLAAARRELARMRLQTSELFVEESWLAEARILREAGDRKEALEVLDLALDELPGSVPIRYSHALFAAELGWVDIAENDLRIIISEQPENSAALNALGYTLADQTERYEEAEALIRQAYILEPDQAAIVDSMGWIAFRRGRLAEAEEYLRRAWALEQNPEIAAHLGEVLWVGGEQDAARFIWREAIKIDSENLVLEETLQRLGAEL
jgi:tetratricopeptide (TPR) repeat protein